MSSLSQFAGGIPFGQIQYLIENRPNPTIDGVEYLRSGVLKSISGYEGLAARYPDLAINVPSQEYTITSTSSFPTSMYIFDGSRYLQFGNSQPRWTSNLTTAWSNSISGYTYNNVVDICQFASSGRIIQLVGQTYGATLSGTYADLINYTTFPGYSQGFCAVNSAGNFGLSVGRLGAGFVNAIYYSNDGYNFYAVTPTVTGTISTNALHRFGWSNIGACFFALMYDGNFVTTTNGVDYTVRGVPSGISGVANSFDSSPGNFHLYASSSTSTICTGTFGSISYLFRTTNGTSWTATQMATLMPERFSGTSRVDSPKLRYFNGAYWLIYPGNTLSKGRSIFKSTDDGVTWASVPSIIRPSRIIAGSNGYQSDVINLNGNTINIVTAVGSDTTGYYSTMSSLDNATHIGVSTPDTSSLLGTSYVRIK